jgi:hypothetical protein
MMTPGPEFGKLPPTATHSTCDIQVTDARVSGFDICIFAQSAPESVDTKASAGYVFEAETFAAVPVHRPPTETQKAFTHETL